MRQSLEAPPTELVRQLRIFLARLREKRDRIRFDFVSASDWPKRERGKRERKKKKKREKREITA